MVPAASFGPLWSTPTDGGTIFAEVLYVPDVTLADGSIHDTVYSCSNRNNCHAMDAGSGELLWTAVVMRAIHGGSVSALPNEDTTGAAVGTDPWGVTSTPIIDVQSSTMFVVSTAKEVVSGSGGVNHYYHQAWQLSLSSGAVVQFVVLAEETATCPVPGAPCIPTEPSGYVSGPINPGISTAPDAVNGALVFQVLRQNQCPGLNIVAGALVVAFAGYHDDSPWHGWMLALDVTDLSISLFQFNTEPNGNAGVSGGRASSCPLTTTGFFTSSPATGTGTRRPPTSELMACPSMATMETACLSSRLTPAWNPTLVGSGFAWWTTGSRTTPSSSLGPGTSIWAPPVSR